jgi:hypothetical protein
MQPITFSRCALRFVLTMGFAALISPVLSQTAENPELQQKVAALKTVRGTEPTVSPPLHLDGNPADHPKREHEGDKTVAMPIRPRWNDTKDCDNPRSAPPSAQRGLKGRIIAKKTNEMQEYMERVASLIKRYTPPDGAAMQSLDRAIRRWYRDDCI